MKLAAVIINYNDSQRVLALTEKLISYQVFSDIVVVDNLSSPEQVSLLKEAEKKEGFSSLHCVYSMTNEGYNRGSNLGFDSLKNKDIDVVYSINSDIDVSKETILALAGFLEKNPSYAVVSCKMMEYGKEKQMYYQFPTIHSACNDNLGITKLFHLKPPIREKHEDYLRVDFVRSSFDAMRYSAIQKVGFYDQGTFLYFGEAMLARKLKKDGFQEAVLVNYSYNHNHIYKKGYKTKGYKDTYREIQYYFKNYGKFGFFSRLRLSLSYHIGWVIRKIARIS
jgi:N-acetylglucosaminyl-diphospho-decaprenol L-rhamnosyltransferase